MNFNKNRVLVIHNIEALEITYQVAQKIDIYNRQLEVDCSVYRKQSSRGVHYQNSVSNKVAFYKKLNEHNTELFYKFFNLLSKLYHIVQIGDTQEGRNKLTLEEVRCRIIASI